LTKEACRGDIKLIQLRIKHRPIDEWLAIARDTVDICDDYNSILIVNDSVEIAKNINADGVHLGEKDMHPKQARMILGENCIIGGTASNFNRIADIAEYVNYIGLGPFRYTTTKQNLAPEIGLDGYREICKMCQNNGIMIPIIAIGGIQLKDVPELMKTGIYGIAVSSAISLSGDIVTTAEEFIEAVYQNGKLEDLIVESELKYEVRNQQTVRALK
jgi:thiamine-phosphate pyrophosphorylase